MDTQKMKREELIQFLESAKKGKLPKGDTVFFKVDNVYYRSNLETPITSKEFENEFRSGFDSLFEIESNTLDSKTIKDLGFNPEDFGQTTHTPQESASIINDLLNKLSNE